MWVGRYEKDRGRTFPVLHEEDDREQRPEIDLQMHFSPPNKLHQT